MSETFLGEGWLESAGSVEGSYVGDGLFEHGLDWETELRPIQDATTGRVVEGYRANVRLTDDKPLAVVGSRYTPVQNRVAFEPLDELVDEGLATIEKIASIKGGRRVLVVSKQTQPLTIAGEKVLPYMAWLNSHDGSSPVTMTPVPTRDFCTNAMVFWVGAKDRYKVKHTRFAQTRLVGEKARVFSEGMGAMTQADAYFRRAKATGERLARSRISEREFEDFLKSLSPIPKEKMGTDEKGRSVVKNLRSINMATNRQEEIRAIYRGEENLNDIRGTRWGALQAVVQWGDHVKSYRSPDSKLEAIVGGVPTTQTALQILSN